MQEGFHLLGISYTLSFAYSSLSTITIATLLLHNFLEDFAQMSMNSEACPDSLFDITFSLLSSDSFCVCVILLLNTYHHLAYYIFYRCIALSCFPLYNFHDGRDFVCFITVSPLTHDRYIINMCLINEITSVSRK